MSVNSREFINTKEISNKILTIKLSNNKDKINFIGYYNAYCYNNSNIMSENYRETISNLPDDAIIKAAYLLCRFDSQKFFDFFSLLQNKRLKDLFMIALTKTYEEYKRCEKKSLKNITYNQNLFKGNIQRDYYYFFCYLNTWLAKISLDENNNISTGYYQKVAVTGVSLNNAGIKEFSLNPTDEKTKLLTLDSISYLSSIICMGDINEYQRLLNTTNSSSKYYKAILQGGALYTNKIKSLKIQLSKKNH